MILKKNTNLLKNIKLNYNKKFHIFSLFFSNYSNCHPTHGDFDDKENIN